MTREEYLDILQNNLQVFRRRKQKISWNITGNILMMPV